MENNEQTLNLDELVKMIQELTEPELEKIIAFARQLELSQQ